MEAAIRLPLTQVYVRHGRLQIEQLTVDDETAARLAAEREDPVRFVTEAIEIGARVLDRELTGANAEFVRAEFEKTARELEATFVERARRVAERLDEKVDEAFGPEHGHVTKALARHFGDESSVAVQHRVRTVLDEVAVRMREDLRKQFSADGDSNPLAGFQNAHLAATRQIAGQQVQHLQAMAEKLEGMKLEISELRSEKQKLAEIAAVAEKGTAKGRSYEEAVAIAIDAIASAQGDDCEAVGDVRGEGGRKGDVVVAIDACAGPARGRIVFEAKNSQLSRNRALAELDEALETRGADFAIFVVPSEDKLPARTRPLREFNGDKMFVVYGADDDARLALEVAYALARARVLMNRGEEESVDAVAVRAEVERALGAMEDVRRIKVHLTNASGGIEDARKILDSMATGVRVHLAAIQHLLAAAGAAAAVE
ncbi:MAG TPA: hypothetical protein VGO80_11535 [Solirubrobacteraceae bacterium]|jgi:hypothetical protein|nr:hypothetical protein [Solirubrobacteraceae bacterium]